MRISQLVGFSSLLILLLVSNPKAEHLRLPVDLKDCSKNESSCSVEETLSFINNILKNYASNQVLDVRERHRFIVTSRPNEKGFYLWAVEIEDIVEEGWGGGFEILPRGWPPPGYVALYLRCPQERKCADLYFSDDNTRWIRKDNQSGVPIALLEKPENGKDWEVLRDANSKPKFVNLDPSKDAKPLSGALYNLGLLLLNQKDPYTGRPKQ